MFDTEQPVLCRLDDTEWQLYRPADLEALWESMTEESFAEDERIPYWVELWPSSVALAQWLHERQTDIEASLCLDIGCGLGLSAMVASRVGARVVAMDYELAALRYAQYNAKANKVPQPYWLTMDWRFPAIRQHCFQYIWGGDIMYERRFIAPVFAFFEYALQPGGVVWIAEPRRNIYSFFKDFFEDKGWNSKVVAQKTISDVKKDLPATSVIIWEICKNEGI